MNLLNPRSRFPNGLNKVKAPNAECERIPREVRRENRCSTHWDITGTMARVRFAAHGAPVLDCANYRQKENLEEASEAEEDACARRRHQRKRRSLLKRWRRKSPCRKGQKPRRHKKRRQKKEGQACGGGVSARGRGPGSGDQSGDVQGSSRLESADSESVDELVGRKGMHSKPTSSPVSNALITLTRRKFTPTKYRRTMCPVSIWTNTSSVRGIKPAVAGTYPAELPGSTGWFC